MKQFVAILVMLLAPSLALAAYQNPTVVSNERQQNGFPRITFQFTGNAGEPVVRRAYMVSSSTTAASLRNWIADTIDELDLMHTAGTLAILQPGQTVPRLNRVAPVRTAKDIWNEKMERYKLVKDLGLTNATAISDLSAMLTDLNSSYQAGFVQP